jgi:hypothetical protein
MADFYHAISEFQFENMLMISPFLILFPSAELLLNCLAFQI